MLSAMEPMSPAKELAVCVLLCERMLPGLIACSKESGFDCSDYLDSLRTAWSALQDARIDRQLIERCSRNAPDTEVYSHPYTPDALNAALAIAETMQFATDENLEHVEYARRLAMDSLELFLGSREDSTISSVEEDSRIRAHPLFRD